MAPVARAPSGFRVTGEGRDAPLPERIAGERPHPEGAPEGRVSKDEERPKGASRGMGPFAATAAFIPAANGDRPAAPCGENHRDRRNHWASVALSTFPGVPGFGVL